MPRDGVAVRGQRLGQVRAVKMVKPVYRKLRRAYNRRFGPGRLRRMMAGSGPRKIVIGSSMRHDPSWTPTDREFLDLLIPGDWSRAFPPNSLDAMLAEHVWEHLPAEGARDAAATCFKYLKPGGYLRIAVPDGLHPDASYLDLVGVGTSRNDHKVLYTYRTLRELFERVGFRVHLHEYFDEAGTFHHSPWDDDAAGRIWRSERRDKRNRDGKLNFTSIILDAIKD
jgi:predicted SAM-dependent methyltransferase